MAYSELIKDFNRIRIYLRSFYVYGFMHRDEFTQKSARSYDNERRRVESWLGRYMSFGQDEDGRRVFLSVDSRAETQNPLYRAFRAKSFTDGDITLHFLIMDILKVSGSLSIKGIMDMLADRLSGFASGELPDESTVRKKLKEYTTMGFIVTKKRNRETFYSLSEDPVDISSWDAAVAFYSEVSPLGVIGSYIQDRLPEKFDKFRFKHHYILNALDTEVLYDIFLAIGEKRLLSFTTRYRNLTVLPVKVYIGTQTGRQYLLAMSPENRKFSFYRADLIDNVKVGDITDLPEDFESSLEYYCSHVWGASGNRHLQPDHIEMTVFAGPEEGFIVERLHREKRCGTVEQVDDSHWRFTADVYECSELLPWIRTFMGRITDLQCTDKNVSDRFWNQCKEMATLYGGEQNDIS